VPHDCLYILNGPQILLLVPFYDFARRLLIEHLSDFMFIFMFLKHIRIQMLRYELFRVLQQLHVL
jgi:hypothetical protein